MSISILNRVAQQIAKTEGLLDELISHREYYVQDRSWQWQESEKCDDYMLLTEEVEDLRQQADFMADQLETLIEEFKNQ